MDTLTGFFAPDDGNPAESSHTKLLRQSYVTAKQRASELGAVSSVNIVSGSQGQKAVKVYTAIAALLNMSITAASSEALEKYIRKTAVQLPASVIDLDEWGNIMDVARDRRGANKKYNQIMHKQKEEYLYLAKLSLDASRTCKTEMNDMKIGIQEDVDILRFHASEMATCVRLYADKFASCQARNKQLESIVDQDVSERGRLQNENASYKTQLTEQEIKLQSYNTVVDQCKAEVQQMKLMHENEVSQLQSTMKSNNTLRNELNQQLADKTKQLNDSIVKCVELESLNASLSSDYNKKLLLEATRGKELEENIRNSFVEFESKEHGLTDRLSSIESNYAELMTKYNKDISALKVELMASKDTVVDLTNHLNSAENESRELAKSVSELHAANDKLKLINADLENEITTSKALAEKQKVTAAAQYQSMQDMYNTQIKEMNQKLSETLGSTAKDIQNQGAATESWMTRAHNAEQKLNELTQINEANKNALAASKTKAINAENQIAELKANIQSYECEMQLLSTRLSQSVPVSAVQSLEVDTTVETSVPAKNSSTKLKNSVTKIAVTNLLTKAKSTSVLPIPIPDALIPDNDSILPTDRSILVQKMVKDMASDYVDFIIGNAMMRVMKLEHPSVDEAIGEEIVIRQINGQISGSNDDGGIHSVVIGGALEDDLDIVEDDGEDLQKTVYLDGPAFETSLTEGSQVQQPSAEVLNVNGSNTTSNSKGFVVMPTITQYLEDIINRFYEKHEILMSQQLYPQQTNSIVLINEGGILSDPAAEALNFLQELRCDIEVMRGNILTAALRQTDMALSGNYTTLTVPYVNTSGESGQHVINEHVPSGVVASAEYVTKQMISHLQCTIGCSKAHVDVIRSQCALNQERVRQLNVLLTRHNPQLNDQPTSASYNAISTNEIPVDDFHQGVPTQFIENGNSIYSAESVVTSSSVGSYNKPLPVGTINMRALVKLQSVVRGFIHRRFVAKKKFAIEAVNQGVLAAVMGTTQGDTGWYTCQGMLFYFCLCAGEFALLCGPITHTIYQVACEELEMKVRQSMYGDDISVSSIIREANARDVVIDRLAVQATRTQIQLLLDTVRNKDMEIDVLRREVLSTRNNCMLDMEAMTTKHAELVESLKVQVKEQKAAANGCRCELLSVRVQLDEAMMKNKAQQDEYKMQLAILQQSVKDGVKLSPRAMATLPSPRATGPAVRPLPQSPRTIQKFVKLQAVLRGILGRRRFNQHKILKASQTTGVLVALNANEQGKTGWYQAPGGDVFYFVRDDQAEWLLAAGPISRVDYDLTIMNNTPTTASGSATSFAMMKKTLSNTPLPYSSGDILRRCNFELAVEHEDVKGELYIANKSNKLYVAVAVDLLLLESQFAYSLGNENSSLANDTLASSFIM